MALGMKDIFSLKRQRFVEDDILFTNHPRASMCKSYNIFFILWLPVLENSKQEVRFENLDWSVHKLSSSNFQMDKIHR